MFLQGIFLQAVGFPHQPFDTVAVHCFFKILIADANTGLQYRPVVLRNPYHPERKIGKTFALRKKLFNCFTAFEFVLFFKLISYVVFQ